MRPTAIAAALALLLTPAAGLASGTFTVLHNFAGAPDGFIPAPYLAITRSGTLFGATDYGGSNNMGTVFELSPPGSGQTRWTETILHSFGNDSPPTGVVPFLITLGSPGHLFVAAQRRESSFARDVIVELSRHGKTWTPQVVHLFGSGNDGDGIPPSSPLLIDKTGAIIGETNYGGADGVGTVFKLTPPATGSTAWSETILFTFSAKADNSPYGQLVLDPAGNLYGTCQMGGDRVDGTAWELSPPASGSGKWTRTVLYSFTAGTDGKSPGGSLLRDAAGNLYGLSNGAIPGDVIWELMPPASGGTAWTEETVFTIERGSDGHTANGIAFDGKGNLVGTTDKVLFELLHPATGQTAWTNRVLSSFRNSYYYPGTPLPASGDRIFGTWGFAQTGPYLNGAVWEFKR